MSVSPSTLVVIGPQGPPERGARRAFASNQKEKAHQGEFYCVKCKAKRTTEGDVVVSENGRRMAKAICPECGTKLNRILGKA